MISSIFKKIAARLALGSFKFWQFFGLHITPVRYDFPIPDTRKLNNKLWQTKGQTHGIDYHLPEQLKLLDLFIDRYKKEYDLLSESIIKDLSFSSLDAEIYYCFIRQNKPKRIIEIGAGSSTKIAKLAIDKNKQEDSNYICTITAIDPYPSRSLKNLKGINLITKAVQNVPLNLFSNLSANDILFIDSSHILSIGSDVKYEYSEILPRLQRDVFVHVHDIFLPNEYPQKWVRGLKRFWNEQYILQALLTFNDSFRILWTSNLFNLKYPDKVHQAINIDSEKIQPGSFWLIKN